MNGKVKFALSFATLAAALSAGAKPFRIMMTISSIDPASHRIDAPIFRDAIMIYSMERGLGVNPYRRPKGFPNDFLEHTPESDRRQTPYKLMDFLPAVMEPELAGVGEKHFMLSIAEARPPYSVSAAGYPLADRNEYAVWKSKHPNFMGFLALAECDSDFSYLNRFRSGIRYADIRDDLNGRFPEDVPSDGFGKHFTWVRRAAADAREFYFGETNLWMMCSNFASYCHLFAAAGASGIFYEATSQGPASWTLAAAYARGASRQFSIPFAWYCAHYYSGFSRDGRKLVGENRWEAQCSPPTRYRAARPHRGASRSLISRQTYAGWLAGAEIIQMEHWARLFTVGKDNGRVLSTEGEDFSALYELSHKVDAGRPVTPLAVLLPLSAPIDTQLRFANKIRDGKSQEIVLRELVRSPKTESVLENRDKGEQGCLYNSPHACMYDVLCPDAGQQPSAFLRALRRYPYALLVGRGFGSKLDCESLSEYVNAGGILAVTDGSMKRRLSLKPNAKGRIVHVPCENEALANFFAQVQKEKMPVQVDGDCLSGENIINDGYLVWIFNNNGVEKYCDEPERFDMTKTSRVRLSCSGKNLDIEVPPGGIRLVIWNKSSAAFRIVR